MATNVSQGERPLPPALQAGIRKRFAQVIVTVGWQAAILLLAAGRLDWGWAWLFVGLNLAGIVLNGSLLIHHSPETIAERAQAEGMKEWDKWVGGLWALLYFLLMLVIAGLDERLGWSGPMPLTVHVAGGIVFVLGFALFSWAMIVNAYFATVVRIQTERGHTVCTTGPYRFVRHPGYAGAILQSLGAPLLLGSWWALLPGALAALLMVIRTALEDRILHEELDDYRAYAERVGFRLLPGVW